MGPIFTHIMSTTTCVNERLPLKNTVEESIPWNDDDLATKKKMKQKKTGYGIISLSVVAALFLVVALKTDTFNIVSNMDGSTAYTQKPNKRKREVYIGAAYGAVAGGGDTTSSLLRTSAVSTSTSKVMAQEDEDSFNIVSMDGSSESTQKTIKKKTKYPKSEETPLY